MTYCPLTHNSFTIDTSGRIGHCCVQDQVVPKVDWSDVTDLDEWYRSDPWMTKVRSDLDNGIRHESCRVCWLNEDKGTRSKRVATQAMGHPPTSITHVDLRLSNRCNLQCKMCHSGSSDQIASMVDKLAAEGIKTGMTTESVVNSKDIDTQRLLELVVKLPNLKTIRLAGGEPFVMPEVEWFLAELVRLGRFDLNLEFITNCTTFKPKVLDQISQFKSVHFMCSLDGVGESLEFHRYPAKWSTIERNFKRIYDTDATISITPSLTMLNLLDTVEFIEWTRQFPRIFNVNYSEVTRPSYLNFRHVPMDVREEFLSTMEATELPPFMSPNWKHFQSTLMYQFDEISDKDIARLHGARRLWDYRCKTPLLVRHPWMKSWFDQTD